MSEYGAMRFRVASIAFFLSVAACGGSSLRRDDAEGQNGGTGALGGGGTETGGGGQGATGGSALGGSGATGPGPLSGDWVIAIGPGNVFYATVTSPTKALVGREYEEAFDYDIVQSSQGEFGPGDGRFPPDTELYGRYVLRRSDGDPSAIDFAIESDDYNTRGAIGYRTRPCNGEEYYAGSVGVARRDVDPPDWRVSPVWGGSPPWGTLVFAPERPVLAPLSAGFTLTIDDDLVAVTWADSTDWYSTAAFGMLHDWPRFVGRSLELRGVLHGTNGLDATVLATIDVPDFGMHEGPVTFASSETPDVALLGEAMHYTPSMLGVCPDGCVGLSTKATVGMRFVRPGASLRVTALFNHIYIDFFAVDGTGATLPTPDGPFGVVETKDIPIPVETDDLFVIFRGPPPIVAGGCPTPANNAYLVSVEPEGVP